jgi:hypothetical protein
MGSIAYMDFDLLIHRDEAGYRAQVLNSPAGQARVTFSMPFSDLEFENLPLRMGRTRGGVRRIDSADVAAAKVFGGRLFATVFDGEVLGCLRSSLDEANRQDAGLRIRLRLTDVPELADLAWEYLYNPTLNRFLALSVETPIVRYLDLPQRIRPLAVTPPLRVLAMISSPDDYPPLDVEQEWAKLHEALSDLEQEDLVTVERLDEATLASLLPRLQRGEYHIFHFIGHGGFDQQAQDGVLILEGGKRRGRPVSGQDLGTLLRDHRPMRLAVLNACEGARTSSTDPFAGTAQSLIQQGVPAVIAMQFEITDEAAITFANAFYGAVAGGYPVDAGLAEARKAIFAQGNSLEWGTPVLYMRAPDGRIFDVKQVSNEERRVLRIAVLYREAQTALAREDWTAATEQLQAVLSLEPTHAEAQARLHEVRQQQELATWYATGQQHYDAGQWQAALEDFRRVRKRGGNYKGVDSLIVMVRSKVKGEKPVLRRINRLWIGVGGALALLVFIGLAWWGMPRVQPALPLRWQSIAVLRGYAAPVKSAVFSPDGKWVVAASYDPTVWVWEASTGKGVAELRGHTAPVKSAVFSPDGKWVATASDDKMARVWEASTGKGVAVLEGHTAPVKSAVFSPDGKWIATASSADPTVWVWEASTGKGVAVLEGHTAPVKSAVFSPDGKRVALLLDSRVLCSCVVREVQLIAQAIEK